MAEPCLSAHTLPGLHPTAGDAWNQDGRFRGGNLRNETRGSLDYKSFCGKVNAGVFICFEMKSAGDSGGEPPTKKRKLDP